MSRAMFLAVAGLTLAACQMSDPPGADQAKSAVANVFTFPSTAEFRSLHPGSLPKQVCGEVRGRMADGQMTDYRKFNWQPGPQGPFIEGVAQGGDPALAQVSDSMLQVGCD